MQQALKECDQCHKFYDVRNINFCLNVAISEKLEDDVTDAQKEYLQKLDTLMTEATGIKWCTCNTELKRSFIEDAETSLETDLSNQKIEEQSLGFDFKLNEDVAYIANEHNFKSTLFLKFVKSLKAMLKEEELLSFDFLNFDKLTIRDFNPKHYYSAPNYLLIYDFENLQEDNIDIIIKINNIIKQRKSNNKKTFVVTNNDFNKLEKFLVTRFYTKDEHIVLEFFNLLKESFLHKIITTIEQDHKVKINTSPIKTKKTRGKAKTTEEPEELFC